MDTCKGVGSIYRGKLYLFIISYFATTELRPQFRRTTAPFITNNDSKLPNQTIVASRLLTSDIVSYRLLTSDIVSYRLLTSDIVSYRLLMRSTVDHADHFL